MSVLTEYTIIVHICFNQGWVVGIHTCVIRARKTGHYALHQKLLDVICIKYILFLQNLKKITFLFNSVLLYFTK